MSSYGAKYCELNPHECHTSVPVKFNKTAAIIGGFVLFFILCLILPCCVTSWLISRNRANANKK